MELQESWDTLVGLEERARAGELEILLDDRFVPNHALVVIQVAETQEVWCLSYWKERLMTAEQTHGEWDFLQDPDWLEAQAT